MKRVHAGVTILEMLTVIAVVSVISAIALPVLSNSVREGKKVRSVSNLRQLHIATQLYVDLYGLDAPKQLPDADSINDSIGHVLRTGGRPRIVGVLESDVYRYMYPYVHKGLDLATVDLMTSQWNNHLASTDGNPVIFVDDTHEDYRDEIIEPFRAKFAMGVYFDGSVKRRRQLGDPGSHKYWE